MDPYATISLKEFKSKLKKKLYEIEIIDSYATTSLQEFKSKLKDELYEIETIQSNITISLQEFKSKLKEKLPDLDYYHFFDFDDIIAYIVKLDEENDIMRGKIEDYENEGIF
jgi:uncharacterized protein YnzC (UPF0291/DUF896 family)